MAQDFSRLYRRLDKIEEQIRQIQQSTRTLFPFMMPVHDLARMHSRAYYRWHLYPYSHLIHWIALLIAVIILSIILVSMISYPRLIDPSSAIGI
jgi:hypothetical protein